MNDKDQVLKKITQLLDLKKTDTNDLMTRFYIEKFFLCVLGQDEITENSFYFKLGLSEINFFLNPQEKCSGAEIELFKDNFSKVLGLNDVIILDFHALIEQAIIEGKKLNFQDDVIKNFYEVLVSKCILLNDLNDIDNIKNIKL